MKLTRLEGDDLIWGVRAGYLLRDRYAKTCWTRSI